MDEEVGRIRAVREQRRATVAAIELAEQWARDHGNHHGFAAVVALYLTSQNAQTVEELQLIEDQAHDALQRFQTEG